MACETCKKIRKVVKDEGRKMAERIKKLRPAKSPSSVV